MELNQKLQELRKQKGLTQEELAGILYVSRTAISKWEAGRGYPNIDSLKAISSFFGITIDQLLSGDELLTLAEHDSRQKENRLCDLLFALLDLSFAMLLFLPLFGQSENGSIQSVSLLSLTGIAPYLKLAYSIIVFATVVCGIVFLALQPCERALWVRNKRKLSFALNALGTLLFIIGSQPYAATFSLLFLLIKALILIRWH